MAEESERLIDFAGRMVPQGGMQQDSPMRTPALDAHPVDVLVDALRAAGKDVDEKSIAEARAVCDELVEAADFCSGKEAFGGHASPLPLASPLVPESDEQAFARSCARLAADIERARAVPVQVFRNVARDTFADSPSLVEHQATAELAPRDPARDPGGEMVGSTPAREAS